MLLSVVYSAANVSGVVEIWTKTVEVGSAREVVDGMFETGLDDEVIWVVVSFSSLEEPS